MKRSLRGTTKLWGRLCGTAAVALLAMVGSVSQAAIITLADEAYPSPATVFTTDPHVGVVANRGLTTTRELRQSFKNPATIDVRKIVVSFDVNNNTSGLRLRIVEVDDVYASTFTAGNLIHTIDLPALSYSNSTQRTGITLSGSDVFTLPRRDAGTTGYALIISQIDQTVSNTGVWHHSNEAGALDEYLGGRYYTEAAGAQGNGHRDYGLAIAAPEPASLGLVLLAVCGVALVRRSRRSD